MSKNDMSIVSNQVQDFQEKYFLDETIWDYFSQIVCENPSATAIIEKRVETGRSFEVSYGTLSAHCISIARNLAMIGVRKGDVVSFQLPNWWEFVAIHLACVALGAVSNPLMPIYRHRELSFMIRDAGARVLIVPKQFRGFDYGSLGIQLRDEIECLQHVFVVGGEGELSFEMALLGKGQNCPMVCEGNRAALAPNDLMQILYTSGTTGQPKGVMHSSNTLFASLAEFSKNCTLRPEDVVFMPSPLAHQTGFCYGMMLSCFLGGSLLLMDIWDAEIGVQLMEQYGACYMFAATPFLKDLVEAQTKLNKDLTQFRMFIASGAPVQPQLVDQARAILGARLFTGWGMTEIGIATITRPDERKTLESDGRALPSGEVRIINDEGHVVSAGQEGRLQYRGAVCCLGYYKRDDLLVVDENGWLDTGDNARMDHEGYIRITGRSKDIIIRGGENIPVVEVENLVLEMREVREAALVAMPDDRLGERGCLFISLQEGCRADLNRVCTHLKSNNITLQYLPEHLEIIEDFPRTPSGKIQKFTLREWAKNIATTLIG